MVQLYEPLMVAVPVLAQVGAGEGQVPWAPAAPVRIANKKPTRQAFLIVSFPKF
jgi:hypothetical protein